MFDDLNPYPCDSPYCVNEGGYWAGRLIVLGVLAKRVVGQCGPCERLACDECAWPIAVTDVEWPHVPGAARAGEYATRSGFRPFWLHCLKCGLRLASAESDPIRIFYIPDGN